MNCKQKNFELLTGTIFKVQISIQRQSHNKQRQEIRFDLRFLIHSTHYARL